MAKITKAFDACIGGEIYPRSFEVGQEVDGEAAEVAGLLGCLEDDGAEKAAGAAAEKAANAAAKKAITAADKAIAAADKAIAAADKRVTVAEKRAAAAEKAADAAERAVAAAAGDPVDDAAEGNAG